MRRIKKLLTENILVELEPLKESKSGIIRPGRGSEALRIGRVLMMGKGKQYRDKFVPMPDIMGKRVGFLILAAILRSEQHQDLPPNQIIIKQGDLLFELDDDCDIEVFA